ncbi:chloride channel protein [Vibrio cholerae]|nr:chloride channel protein [Vibrio cholerae]
MIGGCFGLLLLYVPELTGGGISLICSYARTRYPVWLCLRLDR